MMDGFGDGGSIRNSAMIEELSPFAPNPTGNAVFDASQYAFFGNNVAEEVELGGLEDEDGSSAPADFTEEEFLLHKDEGDLLELHSDIDDLSSTFSKLTRPTVAGVGKDSGSRQTLAQDADFTNWLDRHAFDAETIHQTEKWPSHSSSARFMEPDSSLYRASSFPDQQQEHHLLLQQNARRHEQNLPPLTSYPPLGGRSQQGSLNDLSSHPSNNLYNSPTVSSSGLSVFPSSQLQFNAMPRGSQIGENLPHGHPVNQNQWMTKVGLHPGNHSGLPSNFPPQQNGLMPPQLIQSHHSQQIRIKHPFQPSLGQLTGFQSQLPNPQFSVVNNSDMLDLRDQRAVPLLRRHGMNYPHQVNGGRPRFRFKYMSQEELENIHRMQLAATHCNDPYVEDYYNQACLFRKSSVAKLKHHFCPTNPWDSSSKPAASNEPHPFLQVDALGRVSFSSIRRPRPLLEVDYPNPSGTESKLSVKPLAHEPLFASREMIEDGFKLLLDVDDIDRFMQFNQLQDGRSLRQRRQVLLEDLASSLQLVDPLGVDPLGENRGVNLSLKDDHIFLRIVSLPKGRKLLLRYLELLTPGELTRIVSMAIFRNLRFLFGNIPTDPDECLTTVNLAKAVSSCIRRMELKALAACFASVVCSQEHPPLRPVGSPAGDGASVILKSVLERATELLTDPHDGGNCNEGYRAFWQASFDAFFGLLTHYSFSKYDSVVQSFLAQGSPVVTSAESDVAKAISKEIPVELLRASLPHTSKEQRKVLLEFAQKSMPVLGFRGGS